jgi:hypothetical protein
MREGWSVLLRRMQNLARIPVFSPGCGCPARTRTGVRNLRRAFAVTIEFSFEFVKSALWKDPAFNQIARGRIGPP